MEREPVLGGGVLLGAVALAAHLQHPALQGQRERDRPQHQAHLGEEQARPRRDRHHVEDSQADDDHAGQERGAEAEQQVPGFPVAASGEDGGRGADGHDERESRQRRHLLGRVDAEERRRERGRRQHGRAQHQPVQPRSDGSRAQEGPAVLVPEDEAHAQQHRGQVARAAAQPGPHELGGVSLEAEHRHAQRGQVDRVVEARAVAHGEREQHVVRGRQEEDAEEEPAQELARLVLGQEGLVAQELQLQWHGRARRKLGVDGPREVRARGHGEEHPVVGGRTDVEALAVQQRAAARGGPVHAGAIERWEAEGEQPALWQRSLQVGGEGDPVAPAVAGEARRRRSEPPAGLGRLHGGQVQRPIGVRQRQGRALQAHNRRAPAAARGTSQVPADAETARSRCSTRALRLMPARKTHRYRHKQSSTAVAVRLARHGKSRGMHRLRVHAYRLRAAPSPPGRPDGRWLLDRVRHPWLPRSRRRVERPRAGPVRASSWSSATRGAATGRAACWAGPGVASAEPNAAHRALAALERAGRRARAGHPERGRPAPAGGQPAGRRPARPARRGRVPRVRRPRLARTTCRRSCSPGTRRTGEALAAGLAAPRARRRRALGGGPLGLPRARCRACGGVLKPAVVFFGENVPRAARGRGAGGAAPAPTRCSWSGRR